MLQEDPSLGPNSWLVEEMHDLYRENPSLVSDSWRAYFDNRNGVSVATVHVANGTPNGTTNGTADHAIAAPPAPVAPPAPAPPCRTA